MQEQLKSEKAEVKTTVDAAFVETGVVVILLDPLVFVADALSLEDPVAETEPEPEAELEVAAKMKTRVVSKNAFISKRDGRSAHQLAFRQPSRYSQMISKPHRHSRHKAS